MKKIVSLFVCLALFLTFTVSAYAIMFVADGSAHLRRGPGLSYEPIGLLTDGEVFWAESTTQYYPWFHGYVDEDTEIYRTFGYQEGYVNIDNVRFS